MNFNNNKIPKPRLIVQGNEDVWDFDFGLTDNERHGLRLDQARCAQDGQVMSVFLGLDGAGECTHSTIIPTSLSTD